MNICDEMINHDLGVYIDEHGLEYPIVKYFDADGSETDKHGAVTAVAGCEGRWFNLKLSEFNLSKKELIQ